MELDVGRGSKATVVCGGTGFDVGDLVAFVPVGHSLNGPPFLKRWALAWLLNASVVGKKPVVQVDKKGVLSEGMIVTQKEVSGLSYAKAKRC